MKLLGQFLAESQGLGLEGDTLLYQIAFDSSWTSLGIAQHEGHPLVTPGGMRIKARMWHITSYVPCPMCYIGCTKYYIVHKILWTTFCF